MFSYLDNAIYEGLILEAAIATPNNVEENIRRGRMAMQHVISSHKVEPRAMYRKDIGWIGFEWGEPGITPPRWKNKDRAFNWWNHLKDKYSLFKKGYGISHIIAKRDWEGEFIKEFKGQRGEKVAYKLVEVIARGKPRKDGQYMLLEHIGYRAILRKPPPKYIEVKKDEEWLLTGYKIETEGYEFIFESADGMALQTPPFKSPAAVAVLRHPIPTCLKPFGTRQQAVAANSGKIINPETDMVNMGWLLDL